MQQNDEIFPTRVSLFRQKLSDYKVDSIIFFSMSNIRYFSGFTGSDGAMLITPGKTILLVDGRYTAQAALETTNIQIIEYNDKIMGVIHAIADYRLKHIGFEAAFLTVEMHNKITKSLKTKKFVPLTDELKFIRARKDDQELALMRKAADISSAAILSCIGEIMHGITEKDLALQLELKARASGADQLAFEPIVASGENSAFPHARPTDRKIKNGDFIVMDFGVKYGGYCSDETCTIAFGKLTDKQKHAYQTVKDAHDRALASIKSNIAAGDIDHCVRSVFGKKYSRYFTHGTGHGVGLEVHEAPRLALDSKDILKEKMVVTVEPGLYFPGHWGIRIEDTLLVQKNSCEKLTKMDKKLIAIK